MPHNATVIGTSSTIKASSLGMSISSGGIALGIIQINSDMIALALFGLIVSIIVFAHDYHHGNKEEYPSKWAVLTTGIQYILFGSFALPAGFMAVHTYIFSDVMASMLGGIFSAWFSVAFAKALKRRGIKQIEEGKLR